MFGTTLFPYQVPQKIKITSVKHRFECKLGLCTRTPLVAFHFRDCFGNYVDHRYTWLSYKTLINRDKVIRHMFDDTAKIAITFRGEKKPIKKLLVYMQVKEFFRKLRAEGELLVFRLDHGYQPKPFTGIVEVCEEDPLFNVKKGDVFRSLLGYEEFIQSEVEIVPITNYCNVSHVTDAEFMETLKINKEKRTEKESNYQKQEEKDKQEIYRENQDSLSEDCRSLEGKKRCQEKDGEENERKQQHETATAAEAENVAQNAGKKLNDLTPATASVIVNIWSTIHILGVLKHRLLCVVGVVLLLVMVLAALEPYIEERSEREI